MRRKKMQWDLDKKPARDIGPTKTQKEKKTLEELIPKVGPAALGQMEDDVDDFFEPEGE